VADVVTAGDIGQRLVAAIAACDGFATLVRRQLARATEQHAAALGALAALAGVRNDQMALELREPAIEEVSRLSDPACEFEE
jgi:hypothetical protein